MLEPGRGHVGKEARHAMKREIDVGKWVARAVGRGGVHGLRRGSAFVAVLGLGMVIGLGLAHAVRAQTAAGGAAPNVPPAPPPAAPAPPPPPPTYVGRPIYSEPSTGLQLPPNCVVEASWRARMGTSDHEVWVAVCDGQARAWMVRRQVVEMLATNQARLRFQVLDERIFGTETAGDTLSVQCSGTKSGDNGFVVRGARWRALGKELKLVSATGLIRADVSQQHFVDAPQAAAECSRFPEREAMMRQLQQGPAAPR